MNSQEIMNILDELGKRMAGPAEQVWEIYIKQTMVYGVVDIIIGLALITIAAFTFKYTIKKLNEEVEGEVMGEAESDFIVLISLAAISAMLFAVYFLAHGAMFLTNPAYYVLQEFTTVIK